MESIQDIGSEIWEKLMGWYETAVLMLPNLAMAIVVLLGFVLVAKLLKKGVHKLLTRTSDNEAVNNLLSTIAYIGVIAVGLFFALGVLNLDKTVTSMLAGVGVVGLALGFAFQNTASNLISGILMASRYPLNVGDLIETNDHFGTVEDITLRYTTLRSFQGQTIVIPNKQVLESSLVNYTVTNERRVDLECGVSYSDDLEKAEQVAIDAITQMSSSKKPVEVMYGEFGDSSINFTLRFWLDDPNHKNFLEEKSKAVKALKRAFDENDISIPFPIRTLEFANREFKTIKNGLSLEHSAS
ncbi:MAG: mechanosensitive ion channel [Flavobacteriales bacterium]|nr:mechanosensitive ion channel [Flavobacteriales bacterium]